MYIVKTISIRSKEERNYGYAQEKTALSAMERFIKKTCIDGVLMHDMNNDIVATDTGMVFKTIWEAKT